ncbi:MAG TPA: DUF6789 family protein [Myxococcaceae bacterium]|nr:DUF6789 family protein [Myxococcaceae bacterium]
MASDSVERQELARVSGGGVIAGIVGGLFLVALLLATTALKGQNLWPVFKGASAPFFHQRAMQPGFDAAPVLVGAFLHFLISAGWGWLFAVICFGLSRPVTIAAGAPWGIVVWLGMHYVLLPMVHLGAMARSAPIGMAIIEHVLFGLVLAAAFLPFQRRVPERWPFSRRLTGPR